MRKTWTMIGVLLILVLLLYLLQFPSIYYELKRITSNPDEVREYILSFGLLGPVVIIAIQIIQVVISPIPGMVTSLVAGALYGILWGFLLNVLGVLLGSLAAFYLARRFGKPLVIKIIGERSYDKYNHLVSEKYTIGLFILFFLPFFPDDALCLLAGISAMPLSLFLFFVIIGRAPGLFVSTLVGSGTITLSVPIWMILGIISIVVIYLSIKYNRKIEGYIYQKVEKGKVRMSQYREKNIGRRD